MLESCHDIEDLNVSSRSQYPRQKRSLGRVGWPDGSGLPNQAEVQ